jgi:hypothetical protein
MSTSWPPCVVRCLNRNCGLTIAWILKTCEVTVTIVVTLLRYCNIFIFYLLKLSNRKLSTRQRFFNCKEGQDAYFNVNKISLLLHSRIQQCWSTRIYIVHLQAITNLTQLCGFSFSRKMSLRPSAVSHLLTDWRFIKKTRCWDKTTILYFSTFCVHFDGFWPNLKSLPPTNTVSDKYQICRG